MPLGRHVEAVKILLRSCFEMQESLPQILESVLFSAYRDRGWVDLSEDVKPDEARPFPTMASLLENVPPASGLGRGVSRPERIVSDLGYDERASASLTAAITVRLGSFLRGFKGQIFAGDELDFTKLLTQPVFVELSDVNEPDIRRFLLGALVLRIYGERAAAARRERSSRAPTRLRHLLVLEEAHHFLRSATGSGPSSELIRQSNMLMADAFAEIRALGQGILLADQAPSDLDPAVLRNTGTKLIHRLLYAADCAAMGDSIGLSEDQRLALRRLRTGECVIQSPSVLTPVTCQIRSKAI